MNKKKLLIIILLVFFVSVLVYTYFSYKTSLEYKDRILPFYAQDKWTGKTLYADNPKKIVQSMLAGEEYFKGDFKLTYLDIYKAEIRMRNYGTGDDTKESIEYYVITEKRKAGWEITQYKVHWICSRGLYWPRFWTTTGCS